MLKELYIELQPNMWQSLYQIYVANKALTAQEITQKLSEDIQLHGFTKEQADSTANLFYSFLHNSFCDQVSGYDAHLSLLDVRELKKLLKDEPDIKVRKVLIALAVYTRHNHHPSFWISYDRKFIAHLSGTSKLRVSERQQILAIIHQKYGLSMQVVGSNQPIPCFQLSWQVSQPQISEEENPLVDIGELTPETIEHFATENI